MGKLLNENKVGRQFWYMEDIFKNKGRCDVCLQNLQWQLKSHWPLQFSCYLGLGYTYGKVEIWRSYGPWHWSLLSKSHHKPCVRHLCKNRVKVQLKEPKNKFQQVCKEHVNKKKSSYESQKNGDEGQNDAQVLKTYSSDTMTRNMG